MSPRRPASPAPPAAVAAISDQDARWFDQDCLRLMRERVFRQALKNCGQFRAHPTLAGRAHTALSAIYTDPGHLDTEASVAHARQAMALGEPRAHFLLAAHMMAGHMATGEQDLMKLLDQAQSHHVPAAKAYLKSIRDGQTCQRQARAMPLGQPLFCLFRAELHRTLGAQGMPVRRQDELLWQDDVSGGNVLAGVQAITLQFDLSPDDSIHRLARLSVLFDDTTTSGRRAQLMASLVSKYGPAASKPSNADEAIWTLLDGVVIRLQATGAQSTALIYEHVARWQARGQHLRAQQAQIDRDRIKSDASML